MAAANESQGLKIAVATCVALVVILGVTCYFLYSGMTTAESKMADSEKKLADSDNVRRKNAANLDTLRTKVGFEKIEDFDAVMQEIKKAEDALSNKITEITKSVDKTVNEAQSKGAASENLAKIRQLAQKMASDYLNEPNHRLEPSLERLTDLLGYNLQLLTELSVDYQGLRANLESANQVNADQMAIESNEKKKAQELQMAQLADHEQKRQELLTSIESLKTQNNNLATELATVKSQYRQYQDESKKKLEDILVQMRYYRDQFERTTEIILDSPDGYITYIDYGRMEVRMNISRRMGAYPQMKMSIFDRKSPGVPTEKPKGTIEILEVTDNGSLAKVTETKDPINPIRIGDIVYSPAWSPNDPKRFALIGKLDINRDGKDDRADVRRAIEVSGGIVEYDLPYPGSGHEKGKLTPRASWYITDDRPPFGPPTSRGDNADAILSLEEQDFNKKKTAAISEARLIGVRPMQLERLMTYLGYTPSFVENGRTEMINTHLRNEILHPGGLTPEAAKEMGAGAKAAVPNPDDETPKDANAPVPKEDEKSDDMPK